MPKTIYAVIIGINAYPENPLFGCVNDAVAVCDFCTDLMASNEDITDFKPKLLLAPHRSDLDELREAGISKTNYISPTRANIINAFKHFKQANAENGDICLFYYSGHGSTQGLHHYSGR